VRTVVEEKVATQDQDNDPTEKLKSEVGEKLRNTHAKTLMQIDSAASTSVQQRRRLSWKATDAIVEAQATLDINVPIEEKGIRVEYEFKVKEMALQDLDICFSVKLLQDMGMGTWGSKVIVEPTRVAAAISTIIMVPECGELTFRFDNGYSWLNTKEVTYCIKVLDTRQEAEPPPDPLAASTSLPTLTEPPPISSMARSVDSLALSRSSNDDLEPQSTLSVRAQYAIQYRAKVFAKHKKTSGELQILSASLDAEIKKFEKLRQKHDDTRMKSRAQAKELFERGQQITESEQRRETLKVMLDLWPIQMSQMTCRCFNSQIFRTVVGYGSQEDTALWSAVCKEWEHYIETAPKSAVVYDSPVFRETHFPPTPPRGAEAGTGAGTGAEPGAGARVGQAAADVAQTADGKAAAAFVNGDVGAAGKNGDVDKDEVGGTTKATGEEVAGQEKKWQKRSDYEAWLSSRKGGEEGNEVKPP
jgi:hypothetical protein